jgi:hypothetical protein
MPNVVLGALMLNVLALRGSTNMEVFSLSLELSRGVDPVGHDARDGLLHVLHPLGHLGVAHLVDVLDEVIVLLPERHCGGWAFSTQPEQKKLKKCFNNIGKWAAKLKTTERDI